MTLSTSVSTSISQGTISKITRLFNGTLLDVLNELFQNGRRAGATRIGLRTMTQGGRIFLCVADDGSGIDDPANLVTLGQSGWDDEIASREDPAGMGIFSLAGRYVEVRSWSPRHATGWEMVIRPDDWESRAAIAVMAGDIASGTEIRFELSPAWHQAIDFSVAAAACYFPLPVTLNDKAIDRTDWLDGAHHVEFARGCRIGVFQGRTLADPVPRINFHGVTVPCRLPTIIECAHGPRWSVLIDIVDAPALQLVLPARKEMVENDALEELRSAAVTAIFKAIAATGGHALSFKDWQRAVKHGVELPEARPRLEQWVPLNGECAHSWMPETIDAAGALLMPAYNPDFGQCFGRALGANRDFTTPLVKPEAAFSGYTWYDALAQVEDCVFQISQDGEAYRFSEVEDRPDLKSGRAESITATLHIGAANGTTTMVELATDLFVSYDSSIHFEVEEAAIFLTKNCAIDVDGLTDMLEAICFDPHHDSDADSWDTQHDRFLLDARQTAIEQLLDADEGLIARCAAVVSKNLHWLVPKGKMIAIQLSATATRVEITDLPVTGQDAG